MKSKSQPNNGKRYVGIWKCCDGFSDTEFTIRMRGAKPVVTVLDRADGEKPEIYDIAWDEDQHALSFAVHWSSGRFIKYRLTPSPVLGRVEVTYNLIAQELWELVRLPTVKTGARR